jgi:hypothetical protein
VESPAETTLVANDAPVALEGMSTDHALQLASEGRLVIRLIAPDPVVMAQPDRIAEQIRRSQSAAWRLGEPAPAELASALNAPPVHATSEPDRSRPDHAILDNSAPSPFPQFEGPPAPGADWTPPPAATVYVVQTRLDGAAIDSLRNALAPYGEPTLEESPNPLPLDGAPLNPAAVLWWSQSPAGWTSWASVPVVIDQAR